MQRERPFGSNIYMLVMHKGISFEVNVIMQTHVYGRVYRTTTTEKDE